MLFLQSFLPICIYFLLIILIIIGIILGMRLIELIDRANNVLDNVETKVNSLNGLFNIIDFTTNKVEGFTARATDLGSKIVKRVLKKNNNKEEDDYE